MPKSGTKNDEITPTPPTPVEGKGYREARHFHINENRLPDLVEGNEFVPPNPNPLPPEMAGHPAPYRRRVNPTGLGTPQPIQDR